MLNRSLAELDTAFPLIKGYAAKVIQAGAMLRTPEINENRKWLEKHLCELGVFKDQARDFALHAGTEAPAAAETPEPDLKAAKKVARAAKKAALLACEDMEREAKTETGMDAAIAAATAEQAAAKTAKAVAEMEHQARKVARKTKDGQKTFDSPQEAHAPHEQVADLVKLIARVVALEAKGLAADDKSQYQLEKVQQFYKAAGLTLIEIKTAVAGTEKQFMAALKDNGCELKRTRIYDLIAIGDGKTTVAGLRADIAARVQRFREKEKMKEVSVTNDDVTDAQLFAKVSKLLLAMSSPQQQRTLDWLGKQLADGKPGDATA